MYNSYYNVFVVVALQLIFVRGNVASEIILSVTNNSLFKEYRRRRFRVNKRSIQ